MVQLTRTPRNTWQIVFATCKVSRDGAVARALASRQCGLGSIPAWCQNENQLGLMWLSLYMS